MLGHVDISLCPCSTFRDIQAGDFNIADMNREEAALVRAIQEAAVWYGAAWALSPAWGAAPLQGYRDSYVSDGQISTDDKCWEYCGILDLHHVPGQDQWWLSPSPHAAAYLPVSFSVKHDAQNLGLIIVRVWLKLLMSWIITIKHHVLILHLMLLKMQKTNISWKKYKTLIIKL